MGADRAGAEPRRDGRRNCALSFDYLLYANDPGGVVMLGKDDFLRVKVGADPDHPLMTGTRSAQAAGPGRGRAVRSSAQMPAAVRTQRASEADRRSAPFIPAAHTGYNQPPSAPRQGRRPSDVRRALTELRRSIPVQALQNFWDWRNQLGAHIDTDVAWQELEKSIDEMSLEDCVRFLDHVELHLEAAAAWPGGPVLLLMRDRHFKTILPESGYEGGLSYSEDDGSVDPGGLLSALPPPHADSEFAVSVAGSGGSRLTAAVAGMIAARGREVREKLQATSAQ
jgi:hypothetical protein